MPRAVYGCHEHHFLRQQEIRKNPEWYKAEGLEQRTFWLRFDVHASVHNALMTDEKFMEKYNTTIKKSDLLFNKKRYIKERIEDESSRR